MQENASKLILDVNEILQTPEGCKELCSVLFKNDKGEPLQLYNYQVPTIQTIFYKYPKRSFNTATTRAGKSLAMAIGYILLACFKPGEKIRIIAPSMDKTKIIMGYIIQHFFDSEMISNHLMYDVKNMGAEKLKKELSKKKLTLKNSSEIMSITANLTGQGKSLIGWGATSVGVDECEEIPSEIIRTKIMRMLGDSPDSNVFMITNPIHRGFMFDNHTKPNWDFIKVDCYQCIEEGRLSKEFVDEMETSMFPNEFKIWYLAEWPDEVENQLFTSKALEKMFAPLSKKELQLFDEKPDRLNLGIDVARFGNDLTVLQPTAFYGVKKFLLPRTPYQKRDTMQTVGEVINLGRQDSFNAYNVDDGGVGGGVTDRLKEIPETKTKTHAFIAGENPHKLKRKLNPKEEEDNKKHKNKKAFWYKKFAIDAARGNIRVVHDQYAEILHNQLQKILYEFESNGQLKIIDNQDKSPDFADASMISLFKGFEFAFGFA